MWRSYNCANLQLVVHQPKAGKDLYRLLSGRHRAAVYFIAVLVQILMHHPNEGDHEFLSLSVMRHLALGDGCLMREGRRFRSSRRVIALGAHAIEAQRGCLAVHSPLYPSSIFTQQPRVGIAIRRRWRQTNSSPGRARHKPSNHCAGNAGVLQLYLYARVRTYLLTLHTRPRVQQARGIPRPCISRAK